MKEVNREVQRALDERIRVIEALDSLRLGQKSSLTEDAKKDVAGLRDLAEGQAAALKDVFDIDFNFGADNLDAEIQKVHNAMFESFQQAQADVTTSAAALQQGVNESFEGAATSAATGSQAFTGEMNGVAASISTATTNVNNSLQSMQVGFSTMINNVLDMIGGFVKGINADATSIVADLRRVQNGLGPHPAAQGALQKANRVVLSAGVPDRSSRRSTSPSGTYSTAKK